MSGAQFAPTDAVPSLEGDVRLHAQRQPHVARWDAGIQRLGRRAITEGGKNEVRDQRRTAPAEFVGDGAIEFTATHEGRE